MAAEAISTGASTNPQTAADAYKEAQAMMLATQVAQAKFAAFNQQVSAAMTATSSATNLITSAHQAAGNAAKSLGQNMVDSSRR